MAREFNPSDDIREGDKTSAAWAREVAQGAARDFDGVGPGASDELGARSAQASDDGDMPELYEITSKMQLARETSCDISEGDWLQYICKGRKVRPIFSGAQERQYAIHPSSGDNAMPEVTLFFPEALQQVVGEASKAVFHPTYAVGQRVLVVQTTEHYWIVGRPMYQVRCRLTSDLYPCGSAMAVVVDENCNAVTECFGGHDFRVFDTIDILEFDPRSKAENGTVLYAQWMPDAQGGVGQMEVLQLGGPCCDESESSQIESSVPSESSSVSESAGGQCCDFVTVMFHDIVETDCQTQIWVDGSPIDVINNEARCAPKVTDTYDNWPEPSSCVWETPEFTLYCAAGNRCAYVRVTWAGHTDFGSAGLTVELLDCVTDNVLATWFTPGVHPPGESGPITGIPNTGGDTTFQVPDSTADVVCSDTDCTESSVESVPSECITCFDSLCVEDLPTHTAPTWVVTIDADGCLGKTATVECDSS